MGYYPRFPVAISLWKVGQVRVTHPSAAPYPASKKQGRSLDLHVLGAPPAFVLSRDQTLHEIFFQPFGFFYMVRFLPWLYLTSEYGSIHLAAILPFSLSPV